MTLILVAYGLLFLAGSAWFVVRGFRRRGRRRTAGAAAGPADENAPQTLHPAIDPNVCIGSGACVRACPEKHALALVDGRARLVDAAGCVGHGACRDACPVEAITLVFGGDRRGVDLPELSPRFETNVPGVFIAGELGGMGLVANAARQGVKAVEAIARSLAQGGSPAPPDAVDLVVVGAGPAGIGATLAAHEHGLVYRTIEREATLGGAVRTYPRRKIVMTSPVVLPLYGRVRLHRTTKEALVELWEDVVARTGIRIEHGVRVEGVRRRDDGLLAVTTSAGEILARRVLLAAGRRGPPRRIGAPGDDRPNVFHRLDDPAEHAGVPCFVVGGGDSAVETALALASEPGTPVVLCHRRDRFDRIKPANRERLEQAEASGALRVLRSTRVVSIDADTVDVAPAEGDGEVVRLPARRVFALLGSELPVGLLQSAGIRLQRHFGRKVVDAPGDRAARADGTRAAG